MLTAFLDDATAVQFCTGHRDACRQPSDSACVSRGACVNCGTLIRLSSCVWHLRAVTTFCRKMADSPSPLMEPHHVQHARESLALLQAFEAACKQVAGQSRWVCVMWAHQVWLISAC